ncbi:DUF2798 domain-containing protein [Frigidibacter sp.]|uniref:DUF2798 domain-containing protein n=1 Tax=Frigidibacter sp. TaxID=2586418 RepID=UPI0027328AE7|nr:DUF2798 domain-containing protein [Frigidibacter sp.]MDP3338728.1 DUF2798 domain-containing protein [Frigidibacter sp.]
MKNKTHMILAQVFMTAMMAFSMSGIFTGLHMGLTTLWLAEWARTFVMAWPLAFLLSTVIAPIGIKASGALLARLQPMA